MPRIVLMLALAVFACGNASAQGESADTQSVVVEMNDKTTLVLEDDGSVNGRRLYTLGQELVALDETIQQWKAETETGSQALNGLFSGLKNRGGAKPSKPPVQPKEREEILESVLAVMEQNRADAAEELQEAWKLANGRSWGSPDEHLQSARKSIDSVRGTLEKSMPTSLYCRTEIKSSSEPSNIHYMPEGIFRSGGEDWMSYTPGAKIKIGNYRFRVSGEGAVFNQKVTILQDPFVHIIQPL